MPSPYAAASWHRRHRCGVWARRETAQAYPDDDGERHLPRFDAQVERQQRQRDVATWETGLQ